MHQQPPWKSKQLDAHVGHTYDMVICSVPWTETDLPLMAPAALKPIVEKAGLSCLSVDLNAEIQKLIIGANRMKYILFFTIGILDESIEQDVNDLFDVLSNQILQVNPKFVGISVFTFSSRVATKYLCDCIKKKNSNVQILIGGAGCSWTFSGTADFVAELKKLNLIDHHIKGDAENSLYNFLVGNNKYPGIDSDEAWKNLNNQELSTLPMPNYENYLFDFYKIKALPIIGSRGCVKRCTFCDYVTHWNKFQWRTAENIFDEMVSQYQKYKIRHFKFQDSLINGGLKEFNKLCAMLADYNEKNPDESFRWSSFFVFRDWTPSSEKAWELIAKSGAVQLNVGNESFSQAVRYAMGKKYTNASIIKHFEQAQKHGIHIRSLHIVGYITETQTDIDISKQWLRDNTRFIDTVSFDWGIGLAVVENTYLDDNKDKLGIIVDNSNPMAWTSRHNNSTAEKRKAWALELRELSAQLGFTVTASGQDNHYLLEQSLTEMSDIYIEHIG